MSDVTTISNQVNSRLRRGTAVNPGLPAALAGLVTIQSLHETDGYTSNVFKKDNNLFGYKWVGSRYQQRAGLLSPELDNYGHYANYLDSADELIDWIYRRRAEGKFPIDLGSITTPEQYARLLKAAGFYGAPESEYVKGLKRWGANSVAKGVAWGSVVVLLVALYAAFNYKKFLK